MRRPTVAMIRHPPSAVPTVSAAAHATFAHVGAASVSVCPPASSSAAITPIDFWASLAPWLNASAADIPHSPAPHRRPPAPGSPVRDGTHRADEQQRRHPAEDRRQRERDQDPKHADGPPLLDP